MHGIMEHCETKLKEKYGREVICHTDPRLESTPEIQAIEVQLREIIDQFPPIDFPFVTITTTYQGASPTDIENLISKKIEDAVSEIDGIRHISSASM